MALDSRKYQRAAIEGLKSAELLYSHGRFTDAIYLSGYVVECGLKALLLARTSKREAPETLEAVSRGAKSHNFEYLKWMLQRRACPVPVAIAELFRIVAWWSPDLRYEGVEFNQTETNEFFRAIREIKSWVDRSC